MNLSLFKFTGNYTQTDKKIREKYHPLCYAVVVQLLILVDLKLLCLMDAYGYRML
ncbi:hypothetical protein THF5H11_20254 [Vibrio jasicida]|uniref:Uncharacterized protein n=1 Tax=Vibrio jasicida TaxID=766224 RepID=A0AAU9QI77_9VIBR|nr:hypothetical protein THF5H11_20254 [Vibrio jasicida]CAH1569369.1 hypothetical protein THF1C08_160071 [Vibrio jasicida]CAH1576817.1 hypothetical protein THF1A12_140071 [Vibrio jasicida]CAH1608540.1 hypothetical protein THF5G08_60260 [Vibrio jasicida]